MIRYFFTIFSILCVFLLETLFCYEENYNPLRDSKKCKLTHSGSEYKGDISRSFTGLPCQYWDTTNPLHPVDTSLKDADFPDRSKRLARNYCRNPNQLYAMPWCYTLDPNVIDDVCDVPLCSYEECRITGPGIEYSGHINRTASDRPCVLWSEKLLHQYEVMHNTTLMPSDEHKRKLPDYRFPDGSRKRAANRCRNPNGDKAGPWCLVERDSLAVKISYDWEYCAVPFCEQPGCPTFTSDVSNHTHSIHSHYSSTFLREDDSTIVFGLKLWDPAQWGSATFRLALSMLPLAVDGKTLREMKMGVEVLVGWNGSEVTLTDEEVPEFSPSDVLIDSTKLKYFALNWAGGFISLGFRGQIKPLWIQEYDEESTSLTGLYKGVWKYVSVLGVPGTWSLPFCKEGCPKHITLHLSATRLWPLKRAPFKGYDLSLYVRTRAHALITLRPGPGVLYPRVSIVLAGAFNKTVLTIQTSEEADEDIVFSAYVEDIVSYWKFTNIKITVIGEKLEAYWSTEDSLENQLFLTYQHACIRKTRWFSVSSQTVAHWRIYCEPNGTSIVPKAQRPECIMEDRAEDYNGTQWTSHAGNPCLPWTSSLVPKMEQPHFPDESQLEAVNFCRNPTKDSNGPFCYTLGASTNLTRDIRGHKEYCKPRFCQSAACKISGLGTDYFGLKSVTRSGRTCQTWLAQSPHKIDKSLQSDDLYPTRSVKTAQNFCRNPSRDLGGPWCYTTDPLLDRDRCDVTDCDKSELCTLVITSHTLGSRMKYILPEWRTRGVHFGLKVWDPHSYDPVHIVLSGLDSKGGQAGGYFDLVIGYNKNEYVALSWTDESGSRRECHSMLMPHLVAASKWTGFWVKVSLAAIQLGREGAAGPIFEWGPHGGPCPAARMDLVAFHVDEGRSVGAVFECEECHTEITNTALFDQKYDVDMWKSNGFSNKERSTFLLHVRSSGDFKIGLFRFPASTDYLVISFTSHNILLHAVNPQTGRTMKSSVRMASPLWSEHEWSSVFVEYSELSLNVSLAGQLLLQWNSTALLLVYYYLSVASGTWDSETSGTKVTWSLNCDPPDIDGPPRNGGWGHWGPWDCSVPCGGGSGIRYRKCDKPRPNIFGAPCNGSHSQVGKCNVFKCGDISPYTNELIRSTLKKQASTIFLDESANFKLSCDMNLVRRVVNESPTADFEWNKNGFRLGRRAKDIQDLHETNFTLNLNSVHAHDSGVYTCLVFPDSHSSRKVLSVVSVQVRSPARDYKNSSRSHTIDSRGYTIKRLGDRWRLVCNSGVLASIYRSLRQRWLLNGEVYVGEKYVAIHSERDEIPHINASHEGVWECQVYHKELNLTWTTNWTRLHVLGRASLFTYLLEDKFSAPLFSWLGSESNVAIFIRLVPLALFILVLLSVFVYRKWEKDIYNKKRSPTVSHYQPTAQDETPNVNS